MPWLVDTNVISELGRSHPDPGVLGWAATVARVTISVITVDEICFGLAAKPDPRRTAMFEAILESRCEIVPVSEAIARQGGNLRAAQRLRGHSRTQADMLIAATAAVCGLTLVTRNVRDFEGTGIPVLNPFLG